MRVALAVRLVVNLPFAAEQRRAPGVAGRRIGRAFFLATFSWQDKKKYARASGAEHSASELPPKAVTRTNR